MVFLAIRLFDSEMVNVGENKKKIGEKYAEKISSDMSQQNEKESDSEKEKKECNENVASKVEYNPQTHSLEIIDEKKNKRLRKRDKVKKIKRKRLEKEQLYNENYNDLLLDNLDKATHTTKSPHLVIGNKWFKKIQKNDIMLKLPKGDGLSLLLCSLLSFEDISKKYFIYSEF